MQPPPLVDELRALLALQRNRAEAYNRFEEGFRKFLIQGSDQAGYQELVKQLTSEFGTISGGVRAIEARLRPTRAALADLIVRLQGHEKDKLMLTARLHVQRQKIRALEAAEEFVEPELTYELRGFNLELQSCVAEINEVIDEFQAELQEEMGDAPADGEEEPVSAAASAKP